MYCLEVSSFNSYEFHVNWKLWEILYVRLSKSLIYQRIKENDERDLENDE